MVLVQKPAPGTAAVKYEGDILRVTLDTDGRSGSAFLRTNYGSASLMRDEIIRQVEEGSLPTAGCWHDLPMEKKGNVFCISIPLGEIGVFDFKTFFENEDGTLEWPDGGDFKVKVEPALLWADNTIYNAFIRQFGPNISGQAENPELKQAEKLLREQGYCVQPPSGKFSDVEMCLDHIMDVLGFRIAMFLPVHPASSAFSGMGRFGSPFAPLDFRDVDWSMAKFDRKTTPLQQFMSLVDAVHSKGGLVILDMPFDHTGWASQMQTAHPEWFCRNDDGTFASPGAWGVVWEDLCKLDFNKRELWMELAETALFWCRIGVDGFRCDAGYMIPCEVWKYICAKTRREFPDTVFLLEGLGGPVSTTERLLMEGGLNWAYSESFQQYGYSAESEYLEHVLKSASCSGVLVNFAETHDNTRLAAVSAEWAMHRVASAALLAPAGAFGMANGVEWLATERIDVHGDASLNWGAPMNIVEHVARVNRILRCHPAFSAGAKLRRPSDFSGACISLLRSFGDMKVLVIVNPDQSKSVRVSWPVSEFNPGFKPVDLLSGGVVNIGIEAGRAVFDMPPGMSCCISSAGYISECDHFASVRSQQLRACAVHCIGREAGFNEGTLSGAVSALSAGMCDFMAFCGELGVKRPFIKWRAGRDSARISVFSPDCIVAVEEEHPFFIEINFCGKCLERRRAFRTENGRWTAFLTEIGSLTLHEEHFKASLDIKCRIFANEGMEVHNGTAVVVDADREINVAMMKKAAEIAFGDCGLCANTRGTYTLVPALWGTVDSKYGGLLAVNFNRTAPDLRYVMLPLMKAWLRYRDFSFEFGMAELRDFSFSYGNALRWRFEMPCGPGKTVSVSVVWMLDQDENAGKMIFSLDEMQGMSYDNNEYVLIVRPDVDGRSHHEVTKAYSGAEGVYPGCVKNVPGGFRFSVDGRCLQLVSDDGMFSVEGKWSYNVPLPVERERGLDSSTDLFSPGYFTFKMSNGGKAVINAAAFAEGETVPVMNMNMPVFYGSVPFKDALAYSLRHFYVSRCGEGGVRNGSVIAGYPWFLDWGRDTLICLRGYIAAGEMEMAEDVICQFAQFEENGTLPNMIRGRDTSDRDTSDAPLWLYSAVKDYILAPEGGIEILNMMCGNRRLMDILLQLAGSLWKGASNGVRADIESGLLYSRAHFTWMDTNYPAGTPRAGYPVEIQALWIAAMDFLAEYAASDEWKRRSDMARASFSRLFVRKDGRGLVDCRHAEVFRPAADAVPDDAVRPNQLLAVTLGIVTDLVVGDQILDAVSPLLIPGGIRSLDDAPVVFPQPVSDNGKLLNDPTAPYWGHYSGDEDSRRKPAYHNGTAWGWQMPMLCEAMLLLHPGMKQIPSSWLAVCADVMSSGCIGFIPEIYDGDAPHARKGCPAQAWSMTELLRVALKCM